MPIGSIKILYSVFWLSIAFRFIFPFFYNPLDSLFADTLRHWEAGKNLLNPTVINGIDPKLFQLYMWLLQLISQENRWVIAFITGLLCVSMPYLWYKASREIASRELSIIVALFISCCPTLWLIYGYFMNETILLNMLGLATWMIFRAVRKNEIKSFSVAVIALTLAALTRSVAIPIMIAGICYLLIKGNNKSQNLTLTILIVSFLLIPAGLHSYKSLNIFTPFGYPKVMEIHRKSGSIFIEYKADEEKYMFLLPGIPGRSPFEPFYEYKSPRSNFAYKWKVDTANGEGDWEKALARTNYNFEQYLFDTKENLIFFFLGHSWPETPVTSWKIRDSVAKVTTYPALIDWYHINYRWLWSVYVLIIILGLFFTPNGCRKAVMAGTLLFIAGLILQDTGLISGRFRKPAEPYILMCFIFAVNSMYKRIKT